MRVPEIATELAVDRLTRSRGETYGELSVECGLPATRSLDGHLHQARFNLSSTTARGTVAKVLAARSNALEVDWTDLLEDLCRRVLSAERTGEPIKKVGALPIGQVGPRYRLAPLLPQKQVTILYGDYGSGKTTLGVAMAVAVETGVSIIEGWLPSQAPALILDWEADDDATNRRVRGVSMGAHIPHVVQIDYLNCKRRGPLHGFVEEIARLVDSNGYGLVMIDSVGMASGASGESSDANESAIRLFSAFGYIGTTVLALDHITKADAEATNRPSRPYGSIYKGALARATFELRRTRQPDGTSVLGLYNTKVNDADTLAPVGIRVEHGDDGSIRYERMEGLPTALTRSLALWQRIAAELRYEHLSVEDLAERLEVDQHVVRTTLNRHKQRFAKLPGGSWELLSNAS
jgi:hypothetical protein